MKEEKTKRKAFKTELNEGKAKASKKAKMEIRKKMGDAISFNSMSPAAGDEEGHLV